MGYTPKHEALEALSDDEIIARYNAEAANTVVGTDFYREELSRRRMARESSRTLDLTRTIRTLTWVILALTAANVALVAVPLLRQ
jgi:hypothetical protein